jgi:serine/threonine-protein kinase RsbW
MLTCSDHPVIHFRGFGMAEPTGLPGRAEWLVPVRPSWARAFPGVPWQARAARRFVAQLLDGSPFRDDAVVVVSELFTNALLHTNSGKPGGLIIVQVTRWLLGVRVAVTDQGAAAEPVIQDRGPCRQPAEDGNGLYMVGQLAALDWHDDACGRTICAVLGRRPSDHPGRPPLIPIPAPRHPQQPCAGPRVPVGPCPAAGS